MTYFVDANVFLRTLIEEDKKAHKECIMFLRGVKNNKHRAVTSWLILSEVAWTLASYYEFSRLEVVKAIKGVLGLGGLRVKDDYDPVVAMELYEKWGVKFIDAVVASNRRLRDRKWTVISYDHDFDKLGVLRLSPGQVI